MVRTTSYEFSSDDESFPSSDFLAPKRVPSKTMSPTKRTISSSTVDKEDAPPQPPWTLRSRGHWDLEASAPGSMAKPTSLRRRKLGNSQAIDESLFQKWCEIEPLGKEKKERLASNPKQYEVSESSLKQTTNVDYSLSDSDDSIVLRKRAPRRAGSENKSPEWKRPVAIFDESS